MAISLKMTNKPYKASDVADYIIFLGSQKVVGDNKEREGVTNLKLQKLLYLAQAYFLAKLDKPLFSDSIEAWEFGPVIPNVYHKFKKKGSSPIIIKKDKSNLSLEDKEVINKVWEAFGGYSAGRLVDITHAHTPWKEAYNSANNEISNKTIKEYYTPLLNN
jgi:uncharacterized phage-associated protein